MTTVQRTHDLFYLNENRYNNSKQLFVGIIRDIQADLAERTDAGVVICDFGCAAGEFAYALRRQFPSATIEGYDLLQVLISKAKQEVPTVDFRVGSITDRSICAPGHADYALCVGVLSIFDAFEPIIDNLLYWTRPGGRVFLHGLFNKHPIDVNIKYNLAADYGSGVVEAGWNIFSKQSVSTWLQRRTDVAEFSFTDFHIGVDLQPQDDPVRSWTIKDDTQTRHITNGLCLLQPHAVLKISKQTGDR